MDFMFGHPNPVVFTGDSWYIATGQPSPDLNCAYVGSPRRSDLLEILRHFETLRVPFRICFGEGAAPELGPESERMGMVSVGELTQMTLPTPESRWESPEGITVTEPQNEAEMQQYLAFAAEHYGISGDLIRTSVPRSSLDERRVHYYVARVGKEVAGVGTTTHHDNCIGIWGLHTSEEFRRKGVASAILTRMIFHIPEPDFFYLLSTPEGLTLYEKFGFKKRSTGFVYAGRFG
jgi:GNAT superfamily N-acetyltransferase